MPLASEEELADELVAYGADVVALAPPELAAAVVRRLHRLVGPQQPEQSDRVGEKS